MPLRHQLAAHSPVPARALLAAVRALAPPGAEDDDAALERLLRERYAATEAMLCGSGTEALQLALAVALRRVAPEPAPRLVALPAYGCFDLATAVVGAATQVLLYDLDPCTLAPDESSLERVLAGGARVVVIAPLFGVPVPWEALQARADRYGAVLVEDAAQGHGARWRGRPLGSLGVLSVLSFGRGKGWTGGRGGALLARGGWTMPALRRADTSRGAHCVVGLAGHWMFGRPRLYGIPRSVPALGLGETAYRPPTPVRAMPRPARAALMATRQLADDEAATRRATGARLAEVLGSSSRARTTRVASGGDAGWLRFPVRVRGGLGAVADVARATRLGVAPGYPLVLAQLGALRRRLRDPRGAWPGADALVRELVTLPTHSLVAPAEHDEIVRMFGGDAMRVREAG